MRFVAGLGIANCDIFFLNLPRLPRAGEEVFAAGFDILPGGGVPATMTLLAHLNVPVKLATFLGQDEFSARVERALRESGVSYTNLYEGVGRPTIISSTLVTENNRTFVSYHEPCEMTAALRERMVRMFSGASVMELQPGILDICRAVKAQNPDIQIVMDTGWSDDLSVQNYRDYLALADFYTPNRNEAMKITGTDSPEEALRALAQYFDHPLVKLDSEGCLVMTEGRIVRVPPMTGVQNVDPTGAGDAFLAGFLYGLYNGRNVVDCVRYGNITGGVCVQSVGCLTSHADEQTLLHCADKIRPIMLPNE